MVQAKKFFICRCVVDFVFAEKLVLRNNSMISRKNGKFFTFLLFVATIWVHEKNKNEFTHQKSNTFQWYDAYWLSTFVNSPDTWCLVGALSNLKNLVNQEIYFWLIFQWLVPLITRKCHHYITLFIHQFSSFIIHSFFLQATSVFNNFFRRNHQGDL